MVIPPFCCWLEDKMKSLLLLLHRGGKKLFKINPITPAPAIDDSYIVELTLHTDFIPEK
jgi:hypothetical protein